MSPQAASATWATLQAGSILAEDQQELSPGHLWPAQDPWLRGAKGVEEAGKGLWGGQSSPSRMDMRLQGHVPGHVAASA